MSKKYSEEKLEEARLIFKEIDTDGDNKISVSEIGAMLRKMGEEPTEEDIQSVLDENDLNKDGVIDFDEFLKLLESSFLNEDEEDQAEKAFQSFDKDNDGYLNYEEFRSALSLVSIKHIDEKAKSLFDSIQTDGKLSFEDFKKVAKKGLN